MFFYFHAWLGRAAYSVTKLVTTRLVDGSERTRVAIINDNKILLARDWLGVQKWSLPGGGLEKGEKPAECAIREIHEELSIKVLEKDLRLLETRQVLSGSGAEYTAHLMLATTVNKNFNAHWLEILDAKWWPIDELPEFRSKLIDDILLLAS